MALSKGIAQFNRNFTNRVIGQFAGWLPGFAVLHHTGRTSGRRYRTPIKVFRRCDEYLIALTYGPETDWVRNLLAAGGCEIESRSRRIALVEPRVVNDPERRDLPLVARQFLGLIGVTDFLWLKATDLPGDRAAHCEQIAM